MQEVQTQLNEMLERCKELSSQNKVCNKRSLKKLGIKALHACLYLHPAAQLF